MKSTYGSITALALSFALLLSACGEAAPAAPAETSAPVPAAEETAPPAAESLAPEGVYFSEVMASNKATLADAEGNFPDWLELYNAGTEALDLEGWRLERDGRSWSLPAHTLAPGEYLLLTGTELDGMTIPKAGCTLRLVNAAGGTEDLLTLPAMEEDVSACREPDGSLRMSAFPSPGRENSEAGYLRFQESRTPREGEPVISEAMVYNARYLGINGVYYDWVEIANPWGEPLSLAGWYLSDKGSDRRLFPLPGRTLKPGGSLLIYCSAEDMPVGYLNSGFSLNATRDTLYLSRPDGSLSDYVCLHDIPIDASLGRLAGEGGFWLFDAPSPGKPNEGGARLQAALPVSTTAEGVYEQTDLVTVPLQGEGQIRYTLDGSRPTEASALYTDPVEIRETSVLRAACFREGCLPSESLDLSFILNEGHTLPVVSLVGDPEDLFGAQGLYTLYSFDLERPVSFSLFPENEGAPLQIRCGLKLHGATSKTREKKSFSLKFRDRYEGRLHYDLFQNGVEEFSSILLRMPQEGRPTSYLRDDLIHQLALDLFPSLCAQDQRYAVLYINGAYWGIYDLREAHSETHYARHYGLDESTVTETKGGWGHNCPAEDAADYILNHDLRDPEAWAYAQEHLDLDSIIGWCILQAYSGNFDANSPNTRFYWTDTDQKLHYGLVDLDLGLYSYGGFEIPFAAEYEYQRLAAALLRNDEFKDCFLRKLNDLLLGPLSEAEVHRRIDRLAEPLRPEIKRDMERWRATEENWESMVEYLHNFVDYRGGRSRMLVYSLKNLRDISSEDLETYFPEIPAPTR